MFRIGSGALHSLRDNKGLRPATVTSFPRNDEEFFTTKITKNSLSFANASNVIISERQGCLSYHFSLC